jgi:hypothetical protein
MSRDIHFDEHVSGKWTFVILANGGTQVHPMVESSKLEEIFLLNPLELP